MSTKIFPLPRSKLVWCFSSALFIIIFGKIARDGLRILLLYSTNIEVCFWLFFSSSKAFVCALGSFVHWQTVILTCNIRPYHNIHQYKVYCEWRLTYTLICPFTESFLLSNKVKHKRKIFSKKKNHSLSILFLKWRIFWRTWCIWLFMYTSICDFGIVLKFWHLTYTSMAHLLYTSSIPKPGDVNRTQSNSIVDRIDWLDNQKQSKLEKNVNLWLGFRLTSIGFDWFEQSLRLIRPII